MTKIQTGDLDSLLVPIDSIKPYPGNARKGNLEAIAESLEANGQYRPVTVNRTTGEILTGNHTWQAAKNLGWDKIAATFIEVDEATARRIVLVDNRTSDLGSYDDRALTELLKAVADEEEGLFGTGFGDDDLDDLLAAMQEAGTFAAAGEDPGDAPRALTIEEHNTKRDFSYDEFLARYANRTVRSLVCDYPLPVFQWLITTLDVLRAGEAETNADVIARIVAEASGTEVPSPEQEPASA